MSYLLKALLYFSFFNTKWTVLFYLSHAIPFQKPKTLRLMNVLWSYNIKYFLEEHFFWAVLNTKCLTVRLTSWLRRWMTVIFVCEEKKRRKTMNLHIVNTISFAHFQFVSFFFFVIAWTKTGTIFLISCISALLCENFAKVNYKTHSKFKCSLCAQK